MVKKTYFHMNMNADLKKRLKHFCVDKDTTMTKVVEEAVYLYIKTVDGLEEW